MVTGEGVCVPMPWSRAPPGLSQGPHRICPKTLKPGLRCTKRRGAVAAGDAVVRVEHNGWFCRPICGEALIFVPCRVRQRPGLVRQLRSKFKQTQTSFVWYASDQRRRGTPLGLPQRARATSWCMLACRTRGWM